MRRYLLWILCPLLLAGCGGGGGGNTSSSGGGPVPILPAATGPTEFAIAASNAGINSVPITDFTLGTLGTPSAAALSNSGAEALAVSPNGTLLYAANGSQTINSLAIDPATGTLTPVNSTIGAAINNSGPSFQLKSIGLDATGQNLLAASSGAAVQDVQVFPLNADGSFGIPSEIISSAQLHTAVPSGLATFASGGVTLVAVALQEANPDVILTTFSNGAVGTLVPLSVGNSPTTANAVTFGSVSGQPVLYVVTTESDGSGTLSAIPLTVSGTTVTAGTASTVALPVKGQSVAADNAGHVYAGIHFTDHNVFGFTFAPGATLSANGTAVSTVTPGNPADILIDPSGKLNFILTINDLGNTQNLTEFPLDANGGLGAAGTATTVGDSGAQLAGVKFSN